jgi:glycosyltransferase involved in cell wall biosynthesis
MSYLHPKLDAISCVSHAVSKFLLDLGLPERKVFTIYKGHDPKWYAAPPAVTRDSLDVPADAVVVACAANMRPVKGVDLLIEAAATFEPNEKVYFLLIGEIRDKKIRALHQQMANRPHIKFLGYRKDAVAIVKASDIVVMPSREREGLPKAVLEGMALGKPCIVTAVGGMPELIRDQETGLVVAPGNIPALAEAIRALARSPERRKSYGHAGLARLQAEFSPAKTVEQTLHLYESVLTHKRKP